MKGILINILICIAFTINVAAQSDSTKSVGIDSRYDKALKIAFDSLNNASSILSRIESYKNIASIYFKVKKVGRAIENINHAIDLALEVKNDTSLAKLYNNKGVFYSLTKQWDSCELYTKKALEMDLKSNDFIGASKTYSNLGAIFVKSGKFELAHSYYLKSLALQKKYTNQKEIAYTYNNIGSLYLKQLKLDSAEIYLNKALSLSRVYQDLYAEKKIISNLEKLTIENKNFEKAYFYSNRYSEIWRTLYSSEMLKKITEIELKHKIEKQEQTIQLQQSQLNTNIAITTTLLLTLITLSIFLYHFYTYSKKAKALKNAEKKAFENYVKGQETERMRIAFHLHDDLNHSLMGARISEDKDKYVLQAQEVLNNATGRVFSETIRKFGFQSAMVNHMGESREKGINYHLSSDFHDLRFSVWFEASLLRIVTAFLDCAIVQGQNDMHLYITHEEKKIEIVLITEGHTLSIDNMEPMAASLMVLLEVDVEITEETAVLEIPLYKELIIEPKEEKKYL